MEKSEIYALLLLMDKIEKRELETNDSTEKMCLKEDKEKIKLALATKIFDLPLDDPIFGENLNSSIDLNSTLDLTSTHDLKSTSDLSLTIEKLDSTMVSVPESDPDFDFSDDVSVEDPLSDQNSDNNFTFEPSFQESPIKNTKKQSSEHISTKFKKFLKTKGSVDVQQTKPKSRLPVRTSRDKKNSKK